MTLKELNERSILTAIEHRKKGRESKDLSMKRLLTTVVTICCLFPLAAQAQWGDLKLKFVLDGKPSAAAPIAVTKDPQFCGKHGLKDESVVIDAKTGAISNVVVFMYLTSTAKKPKVHPDYSKVDGTEASLKNQNCRYQPRILTMMTSQTLLAANPDPVGHNTKIDTFDPANPAQNFNLPAGAEVKHKFNVEERLPIPVSCSIHPWMKAYILIKDNPYMGVSDANGEVTIKNVPEGSWRFRIWQETAGYISDAKSSVKLSKGRFDVTIKSGMNDLGTFKVSADEFK